MAPSFVDFVASLLASAEARRRYAADPAASAAAFGLGGDELALAAGLSPEQLERQASLLVRKRYHEVARLAPLLMRWLGPRAWPLFAGYAEGYWPTGAARHRHDACRFLWYAWRCRHAPLPLKARTSGCAPAAKT